MAYKRPKVPNKPTLPFTREEMIGILTALGPYCKSTGLRNAQRLMAFILLLYYSGLRIGDAVQLNVNRLQANKLLLHTEKTGVHVYCVLPNSVRVSLMDDILEGDKAVYGQFRLYVTQLERAVPSSYLFLEGGTANFSVVFIFGASARRFPSVQRILRR
jgi:integrase